MSTTLSTRTRLAAGFACAALAFVTLQQARAAPGGDAALAGSDKPAKSDAAKSDAAKSDAAKSDAAPSSLVILFEPGSSELRAKDQAILDHASRAYNQGKPIVMIITGSSDRTGAAQANLTLSERRATNVLRGLLDRGIPADRFQLLAKGETELAVPTPRGVAESQNRRVVISWH